MCENTSRFDEQPLGRAGVAPGVFKACASLLQQRTARKNRPGWPVGSACRVAYRRVACLYRRVAPTLTVSVNTLPSASRAFPGASLGVQQCSALQIDPKCLALMLGRHGVLSSVLKMKRFPSTLLSHVISKQIFNGLKL